MGDGRGGRGDRLVFCVQYAGVEVLALLLS